MADRTMAEDGSEADGGPRDGAALREPEEGFVFATTGAAYTQMARRAVRSLRQVMPDAVVDLFTDQAIEDDQFDRIIRLDRSWFRPKMEALRRSRFERTVYLDSDCIVIADVSDIFEILERFDVAGVQHHLRNWKMGRTSSRTGAPRAFPQIVTAVLGIRRGAGTMQLLEDWERVLRETEGPKDQPVLRDLLWEGNLRIHVLPMDYDVHMPVPTLPQMDSSNAAPKILHYSQLQKPPYGDPETPFDLAEIAGPMVARHVARLQAADAHMGGDPSVPVPALTYSIRATLRRLLWRRLRHPFAPRNVER